MTAFIAITFPWVLAARLTWTLHAERREHGRQLDAVRQDAGTLVNDLVILRRHLTRAVEFRRQQYAAAREARRWQVSR